MPCLIVYSKATRDKWQIRVEREHVMVVGTGKITLHIPESHTLKDKRQVLRSLMSRVRQTFEVSIAEVDSLDRWQAATLGLAVVSNDARHADEVIAKVVSFIEDTRLDIEVTGYETEILHL